METDCIVSTDSWQPLVADEVLAYAHLIHMSHHNHTTEHDITGFSTSHTLPNCIFFSIFGPSDQGLASCLPY